MYDLAWGLLLGDHNPVGPRRGSVTRQAEGPARPATRSMGRVIMEMKELMGNPTEDKEGSGRPKAVRDTESKSWKVPRKY